MMVRVKHSVTAHSRHKKILKQASGYYGARSRSYRIAYQSVIKSGQYSYRDRRQKKRLFRRLWIRRINAASRQFGMSYNFLAHHLKKSSIFINRKMLSDLAMFDKKSFLMILEKIKSNL